MPLRIALVSIAAAAVFILLLLTIPQKANPCFRHSSDDDSLISSSFYRAALSFISNTMMMSIVQTLSSVLVCNTSTNVLEIDATVTCWTGFHRSVAVLSMSVLAPKRSVTNRFSLFAGFCLLISFQPQRFLGTFISLPLSCFTVSALRPCQCAGLPLREKSFPVPPTLFGALPITKR